MDSPGSLVERVEAHLLEQREGKLEGREVRFRCPHPERHKNGDAHPSALFNAQRGVWHCPVCGGGGSVTHLAEALGLLPRGLSLEELAKAKGLPLDFLKSWGLRTVKGNPPAVAIPWWGREGPTDRPPGEHIRRRLDKEGEGPRWTWRGKPRCPYGAWRVADWVAEARERGLAAYIWVCEGEMDALTLWWCGVPALATGGASFWRGGWGEHLRGFQSILIAQEPDPGGEAMVKKVGASSGEGGVEGGVMVVPFPEEARDPNGLFLRLGTDQEAFQQALKEMATQARSQAPSSPAPSLGEVLDEVAAFLKRFVRFQNEHQAVAVALWVSHTHAFDAADTTPYLSITSPEKRSGKTRLLEVLEVLVRRPWLAVQPSEAVLFRKVERDCPALLLDEVDSIFRNPPPPQCEPLRALLNAGHRQGVKVSRCVGKGAEIELAEFSVFCPKALAGLGDLPPTVADRSIPIRLARRAPGEKVEPFRYREAREEGRPLGEALAGWSRGAVARLREARPQVPAGVNDRASEGWEPLLAIADEAGGEWPQKARGAALALHREGGADSESDGVLLLAAIQEIFQSNGVDRIATADLLAALVEREVGPWGEWWSRQVQGGDTRGPAHRLAKLLKPYGISPKTVRVGDATPRGYLREDFKDAFSRYLRHPAEKERNNETSEFDPDIKKERNKTPSDTPLFHSSSKADPDINVSLLRSFGDGRGEEDVVEV